jgi:hypothetical protein
MTPMKRICLAIICFFVLGCLIHAQDVTPAMESDFLAKFKVAVALKDYKVFLGLSSQSGTVDPAMNDRLHKMTEQLFDMIAAMSAPEYKFNPPAANQASSFAFEGKTYEPNLKIVMLLQVHDPNAAAGSPASGTWGIPLGVENGSLKVVQTVLKP